MTIASALEHFIISVDPDKASAVFGASLTSLAAFGAALVALRVGWGSRTVAAREKGPILRIEQAILAGDRTSLTIGVANVGAAPARWVTVRSSHAGAFRGRFEKAVLKKDETLDVELPIGGIPAGPMTIRIELAWIGLDDRVQRDAMVLDFDAGNAFRGERALSTRAPARLIRRLSGG